MNKEICKKCWAKKKAITRNSLYTGWNELFDVTEDSPVYGLPVDDLLWERGCICCVETKVTFPRIDLAGVLKDVISLDCYRWLSDKSYLCYDFKANGIPVTCPYKLEHLMMDDEQCQSD